MKPLCILTPTEQVALHLEQEINSGNLTNELPGVKNLSLTLGVNHKTVDGAVKILQNKGLVRSNGTGKKRSITPQGKTRRKAMKVNILLGDPDDARHYYMVDLRDKLIQTGHISKFATKSLAELRMDPARIKRYIDKNPADAWVVQAASREVLEWFSTQHIPAFALFGRFRNVSIAGTGMTKEDAITDAVNELYQLGHRRIVMLVQEEQCLPNPGTHPESFPARTRKTRHPIGAL
jgi:hypothetical protein